MEEVRKQHDGIKKLYEQGLRGATASVEQVLDLFDTIEALQAENEQLQAQVAQYREAVEVLETVTEHLENCYGRNTPDTEKAREVLKTVWLI